MSTRGTGCLGACFLDRPHVEIAALTESRISNPPLPLWRIQRKRQLFRVRSEALRSGSSDYISDYIFVCTEDRGSVSVGGQMTVGFIDAVHILCHSDRQFTKAYSVTE